MSIVQRTASHPALSPELQGRGEYISLPAYTPVHPITTFANTKAISVRYIDQTPNPTDQTASNNAQPAAVRLAVGDGDVGIKEGNCTAFHFLELST